MREKLAKKNQSVERVFQIIEVMAENKGPMRLQDISTTLNLSASTALRLLNTLMTYKYVYQDTETLKYSLSIKFCQIGDMVHSQISIRDIASPFLKELSERCQESACIAVEDDMMAVYIDVVDGPDKMLRIMQRIGKRAPLHSTGVGKLLLLNYSQEDLSKLVKQKGLMKLTENTITTLDNLVSELKKVESQGFAYDSEECEIGAKCIAAPIRDYSSRVIACISVSGPTSRMSDEKCSDILEVILEISDRISKKLGGTPQCF